MNLLLHISGILCFNYKCNVLFSLHELREKVHTEHQTTQKQQYEQGPKASEGYGGKFGVQTDRMDKVVCCAVNGFSQVFVNGQDWFIYGRLMQINNYTKVGFCPDHIMPYRTLCLFSL